MRSSFYTALDTANKTHAYTGNLEDLSPDMIMQNEDQLTGHMVAPIGFLNRSVAARTALGSFCFEFVARFLLRHPKVSVLSRSRQYC
jgi:hypothetical protein